MAMRAVLASADEAQREARLLDSLLAESVPLAMRAEWGTDGLLDGNIDDHA